MGAYRTIIGCNLQQFETGSFEPTRYLILDTQDEKSVTANAVIAQQPLQNGDTMSDHMYREPVKFTISGSFALNGKNWNDDSYNFMEKGDRLTNIQEVFEYIKNNGILCRLTTIDEDDYVNNNGGITIKSNTKSRFKTRNNMALTGIQWVEKQNLIKYTFNFVEVIMVEAQEYEELTDEEREALNLPHVTSPTGSSLGQVLADTNQLAQSIITTLYNNDYIDDSFFRAVVDGGAQLFNSIKIYAAVSAVAVTVGLVVAAVVATKLVALGVIASVSAAFPAGTIVAGVAAIITGLAVGIANFVNWIKKRNKQKKAFQLVNGKPDTDAKRLNNLLDDIELVVNKVKTGLTIYQINGNYRQTVILNIAGEYYSIEFDQSNAQKGYKWGAKVTDMEGMSLSTLQHNWCPVSSFMDLDRNTNMWFKDKTKEYEVYLVNPSLSSSVNSKQNESKNAGDNLESYSIWVSRGRIQEHIEKIQQAIEDAIEAEGFI